MKIAWGSRSRRTRTPAAWSALVAIACSLAAAPPARAVAPAPWLLERARGTAAEAAERERILRWIELRGGGVDKVYSEFALDMSRYPRGGVARRNILVVLAQFADMKPSSRSTPSYYQKLFFSDDPSDRITSMKEYYREVSNGRLILSGQVTSKWLDMPQTYAYYVNGNGGLSFNAYPRSAQKLAEDAMAAAYQDFGGKLGYFDNDGPDGVSHSGDDDGYIDAVCVIHPGLGAEVIPTGQGLDPYDFLWSHEAGIAIYSPCPGTGGGPGCLPGMQLGDVRGFLYFMGGEYNAFPGDDAVGTYCHEFGHTIGLPDLYDPVNAGLGFYSLMGLGNYLPFLGEEGRVFGSVPSNLDAWSRQFLGFDPITIPNAPGPYAIEPAARGGGSLRVWTNGEPGTEYFLLENRAKVGNDRFLPGDGLLIYHVDDTQQDNLSGPAFYRVRVVDADSVSPGDLESSAGNFGDARDFWPGALARRSWTDLTTPNSNDYASNDTGLRLFNIAGGAGDGSETVTFDLALSTGPALRLVEPVYQDGTSGYPDPNETGDLQIVVENVGAASGPLTFTLTSLDPLVTVLQGTSPAPAAASNGTSANTTPFQVQFGSPVDLPAGVFLRLSWSDGGASGSFDFTMTIGQQNGLAEGFEDDLLASGWSSGPIAPSAFNEWHRTQVRTHGGGYAAKIGSTNPLGTGSNEAQTYRNNQDAALVSPGFYLPMGSQLSFYSWVDSETNGGTGAWDGGRVEISLSGGPWIPLEVDGGYPYMIEFNAGTALAGGNAVAGHSAGWRRFVAHLPYQGPARIRFRFASDDQNLPTDQNGALVRYYEGWYLDDIVVEASQTPAPTARHVAFRAGPSPFFVGGGYAAAARFRFSAPDGLPHPSERPVVRIYDLRGRLVREVTARPDPIAAAEFGASWDGRNTTGEPAAAGVYFAQVTILGKTQSARLVVVR